MLKQRKKNQPWAAKLLAAAAASLLFIGYGAVIHAEDAAGPAPQAPPPPQAQAQPNPMQEANMRLQQIDARLSAAQERALSTDTVSEQREKLDKLVRDRIVEADDSLASVLEEHQELQDELMAHPELQDPTTPPSEEVQARIQEYQELDQRIAPARQAAMQSETVIEAQEEFRTVLIAEMERVEPETQDLIEEGQRLMQQMQQMQQQQMQQQQGQGGPPPAPRGED